LASPHANRDTPGRDRSPRTVTAAERAQARKVSLRRIGRLFAPHRWPLAIVTALIVASSLVGLASPFLLRAVIDTALPEQNLRLLAWLVAAMVAVAAVTSAFGVVQTWISTKVGQHIMHELRTSVFTHLQRQSVAFFTRTRTGEVQSRIQNDIGGMESVVTSTATSIASNLTTAVATAVAMVALSWRLSLISLVVMPPAIFLTRKVAKMRRAITTAQQRELADLNVTIEEGLSVNGVQLAKTMGAGPALVRRFTGSSARLIDLELRSQLAGRWRMASLSIIFAAIPAVIYLAAGLPVSAGTVSIGTLIAFTTLQNNLFRPVTGLLSTSVSVISSLALFARIFEYLDLPVEVDEPARPAAIDPAQVTGHVRFDDVSFTYPGADRPALTWTSRPAARSPWSARPDQARPPSAPWSPGSATRPAAPSASTAPTSATYGWPTWPPSSAWSARRPISCTPPCGRTCATPSPAPPTPRLRTPPARRRSTT